MLPLRVTIRGRFPEAIGIVRKESLAHPTMRCLRCRNLRSGCANLWLLPGPRVYAARATLLHSYLRKMRKEFEYSIVEGPPSGEIESRSCNGAIHRRNHPGLVSAPYSTNFSAESEGHARNSTSAFSRNDLERQGIPHSGANLSAIVSGFQYPVL